MLAQCIGVEICISPLPQTVTDIITKTKFITLFRLIECRILLFIRVKSLVEEEMEDVSKITSISLAPSLVNQIDEAENNLLETN